MSAPLPIRLALLLLVAAALQAASPPPAPSKVPLGRANPFKPLIMDDPPGAAVPPPAGPIGAPPLLALPALPPAPTPAPPTYVAVAWDEGPGGSAVAALQVDGRTRFVRVGDRVGRERVVAIGAEAVTLRSATRTTILPLAKRR